MMSISHEVGAKEKSVGSDSVDARCIGSKQACTKAKWPLISVQFYERQMHTRRFTRHSTFWMHCLSCCTVGFRFVALASYLHCSPMDETGVPRLFGQEGISDPCPLGPRGGSATTATQNQARNYLTELVQSSFGTAVLGMLRDDWWVPFATVSRRISWHSRSTKDRLLVCQVLPRLEQEAAAVISCYSG